MISGSKVLALVPARAGSKGLPDKNIRPFCGKPLLQWSVEHGLASRYVDRVVVSTDSDTYADIARKAGADVPFLRPPSLASDTSTSFDAILHAVDTLVGQGETYAILVLLEPTSPLRMPEDIDGALDLLLSTPGAESVVSVARVESQHPAFLMKMAASGFLEPYLPDFKPCRRQDISPLHFLEGTVYASRIDALRRHGGFHHGKTIGYEVPPYRSFEVDSPEDFIICEALHKAIFQHKES